MKNWWNFEVLVQKKEKKGAEAKSYEKYNNHGGNFTI
jgi:hypothetical protein